MSMTPDNRALPSSYFGSLRAPSLLGRSCSHRGATDASRVVSRFLHSPTCNRPLPT